MVSNMQYRLNPLQSCVTTLAWRICRMSCRLKATLGPKSHCMNQRIAGFVFILIIVCFAAGCAAPAELTSIQVTPASTSVGEVGTNVQFTALGTYSHGRHPSETQDITSSVTWSSSTTATATIDSLGLATSVGSGVTTITASLGSQLGPVSGTANLNVTGSAEPGLTAITVIPASQTLNTIGETAQLIAIGTFNSTPTTQDLTDSVTWQSSDMDVAIVNSSGMVTAVGCATSSCMTSVTASSKLADGTLILGTSALTISAGPGTNLPSLSVYQVGSGNGTVVSSPVGINCLSGTGCVGYFPLGSSVTLTVVPSPGSLFGGWSANCIPTTAPSCTVVMNTNQTVGAIFN